MDLVIGSTPLHRKVNGCPKGQSKSAICSDKIFAGSDDYCSLSQKAAERRTVGTIYPALNVRKGRAAKPFQFYPYDREKDA